jgi:hypothetical protein
MGRKHPHPVPAAIPKRADDFTLVKGIGPTITSRLYATGITTFAQLAALSPADVATRLGGPSARRISQEKWISQARSLAHKKPPADRQAIAATNEIRQHYATFTVELLLDADNSVRRTRITQVQTEAEEAWPGWQEARLMAFVVQRAGLCIARPEPAYSVPAVAYTQPSSQLPSPTAGTCLRGTLHVGEVTIVSLRSGMPLNNVRAGETFNVRVVLDLTEVETPAGAPLNCTVTIWGKKLGVKSRQRIGEARATLLSADRVPCTADAVIDSQGTYHLEVLAALTEQGGESLPQNVLFATQTSTLLQVF